MAGWSWVGQGVSSTHLRYLRLQATGYGGVSETLRNEILNEDAKLYCFSKILQNNGDHIIIQVRAGQTREIFDDLSPIYDYTDLFDPLFSLYFLEV